VNDHQHFAAERRLPTRQLHEEKRLSSAGTAAHDRSFVLLDAFQAFVLLIGKVLHLMKRHADTQAQW
jgi:hypothetical protein